MAKGIPRNGKRKVKIKLSSSAKLVHKNDKTRVANKYKADSLRQAPTRVYVPDNGATFKIKIRKK